MRVVRWQAWRRFCVILLVVPLFTSNIVRAFGWMVLLGRNGLVNQALVGVGAADRPVRFIGTELGILIAWSTCCCLSSCWRWAMRWPG